MALQIAPSERLRQPEIEGGDAALLGRLERALALLCDGSEEAVREVARSGRSAP